MSEGRIVDQSDSFLYLFIYFWFLGGNSFRRPTVSNSDLKSVSSARSQLQSASVFCQTLFWRAA